MDIIERNNKPIDKIKKHLLLLPLVRKVIMLSNLQESD